MTIQWKRRVASRPLPKPANFAAKVSPVTRFQIMQVISSVCGSGERERVCVITLERMTQFELDLPAKSAHLSMFITHFGLLLMIFDEIELRAARLLCVSVSLCAISQDHTPRCRAHLKPSSAHHHRRMHSIIFLSSSD